MRILIVDDEASIRKTTTIAVQTMGHEAVEAPTGARALKLVETEGFDVCFLDVKLGAEDGLQVMEKLLRRRAGLAVVMFTAFANIATAVEAMRRGAFDFIPKPFTPEQVRQVLQKIVRTRTLEQRVRQLESQLADESPEIDLDLGRARRATGAGYRLSGRGHDRDSILIVGPSGTGKNVLAREIHRRSAQRDRPFVTVNCPSLSKELLESELFGHVKGAFTGAVQDTFGKVAAAEGGTLFLDEIGEMPLEIQPKLLRLLQDREYERVGEARPRRANVRVIAASNRDLAAEIKTGRFRQDLFYRLNVITVALPGLHERPGDLLRLAARGLDFFSRHLGKKLRSLSPEATAAFRAYAWPGNLRELRNVIERAVILANGEILTLADLPEEFSQRPDPSVQVGARVSLEALEAEHVRRILAVSATLEDASRTLGIDPATLYRKRQKLGLS